MRERIEQQVAEIVDTAQAISDPSAERRSQAIAAMEAIGRRAMKRHSYRWVAVAVFVVVGLVGLSFVPLPSRTAKGALDRALAAAAQAQTVHIVELRHDLPGGEYGPEQWYEQWLTQDGFERFEIREGRRITYQKLVDGPWETKFYDPGTFGKPGWAEVDYNPCLLHPPVMPDREQFLRQAVGFAKYFAAREGPAPTVREFREGSQSGVEIEITMTTGTSCANGIECRPGDKRLLQAELDPDTNVLLSERQYLISQGQQHLVKETKYEWNVEVPEEVTRLEWPKGTKVHRSVDWETRASHVIAQGAIASWKVTLHDVEVQENGKVLLWVSLVSKPEARDTVLITGLPPRVEAVGRGGEHYMQDNGYGCYTGRYVGYWTTTLNPVNPKSRPSHLTLTIWPSTEDTQKGESVTFRDTPVPVK